MIYAEMKQADDKPKAILAIEYKKNPDVKEENPESPPPPEPEPEPVKVETPASEPPPPDLLVIIQYTWCVGIPIRSAFSLNINNTRYLSLCRAWMTLLLLQQS